MFVHDYLFACEISTERTLALMCFIYLHQILGGYSLSRPIDNCFIKSYPYLYYSYNYVQFCGNLEKSS